MSSSTAGWSTSIRPTRRAAAAGGAAAASKRGGRRTNRTLPREKARHINRDAVADQRQSAARITLHVEQIARCAPHAYRMLSGAHRERSGRAGVEFEKNRLINGDRQRSAGDIWTDFRGVGATTAGPRHRVPHTIYLNVREDDGLGYKGHGATSPVAYPGLERRQLSRDARFGLRNSQLQ